MVKQIHITKTNYDIYRVSWIGSDNAIEGWHPKNSADDNRNFEFADYMEMVNFWLRLGDNNAVATK